MGAIRMQPFDGLQDKMQVRPQSRRGDQLGVRTCRAGENQEPSEPGYDLEWKRNGQFRILTLNATAV
jgi:hypothetical protein